MLKNYLVSALCSTSALHLSLFQLSFSFSFSTSFFCFSLLVSASFFCFFSSGQPLFLLLFSSPSAPLFFFLFFCFIPLSLAPLSSFLLDVLPFFYQPKTFFTSAQNLFSAQNVFASAQNTFSVQPKTFLLQPKILFQFNPKISPCLWFSTSFFLFLFFLPFFSAFSHYVFPFFSPSVQLKNFFTCFMSLYLSKSSFSSNLK